MAVTFAVTVAMIVRCAVNGGGVAGTAGVVSCAGALTASVVPRTAARNKDEPKVVFKLCVFAIFIVFVFWNLN